MKDKMEKQRLELLARLKQLVNEKTDKKEAKLVNDFAKRYFAMASFDELNARKTEELFAILYSHWKLIYKRKKDEGKVKVFNPEKKRNGWSSNYTVIQISHDNMPFLVDSIRMYINRQGFLIRFMIHTGGIDVVRDSQHKITKILSKNLSRVNDLTEAPIYVEINQKLDKKALHNLQHSLEMVLNDVAAVVDDWEAMRARMQQSLKLLDIEPPPLNQQEIEESKAFLRWLLDDNFILLGCRDFRVVEKGNKKQLHSIPNSGFGVLRHTIKHVADDDILEFPNEVRDLISSSHILIFAKTCTQATIHRDVYTDYVGVKQFDAKGKSVKERRFIGLYTSDAYHTNPRFIPFLRLKVDKVLELSNLIPVSYAGKTLRSILENLPKEDLAQAHIKELLKIAMGILHLQEKQRIRLFIRKDNYGRFYSCLLFLPRDKLNTKLRWKVQNILMRELGGKTVTFVTDFLSAALVRIHFTIYVDAPSSGKINYHTIENKIIAAAETWSDQFRVKLCKVFGNQDGLKYLENYKDIFPASYIEDMNAAIAVHDIDHIESLTDEDSLSLSFYKDSSDVKKSLHLKLFRRHHHITLSEVLPMLENMGVQIIDERQYKIALREKVTIWINDFELEYKKNAKLEVDSVRYIFREAFKAIWYGSAENDGFNKLVLSSQLTWGEIAMLRAYAKYLRQIGLTYSQSYVEETLNNNANIVRYLVDLFRNRFNPVVKRSEVVVSSIESDIANALEQVVSLDQDRILRNFLEVMQATIRTNYYQAGETLKTYISFKFDCSKISELPLPHPMYEIFVYSPRFEGVHLRGAKVARGGLRWSDRREDFRTEILGLMKAQQVKNAVIVPYGAKGGFVVKNMPEESAREEILQEGIYCYKEFIKGLLDITDNIKNQQIVHPEDVVCYDAADPYLVVAADKGTATFSDIANEIAQVRGFWLGDAFASGGSTGYDHKKMGITAKGAWESVKRHFYELNIDIQKQSFTVVGIGDMAGDVFGNGMLLSTQIKLVAAFDHKHIFIDPNPNPQTSFTERARLFRLARSTWSDYNRAKIAKGGGVFSRALKHIKLSPEMKELFKTTRERLEPNNLILAILHLEVDLLWNGGIGTFVKASTESNFNVEDRNNDAVRINADELKCKVIGEGGNLGLTQLARVEYALHGGRVYTDFIDNSAGVDCSDHEVNIKILLNQVVAEGGISEAARNKILVNTTDEVAALVLQDNYRQTQAISLAAFNAAKNFDLYARVLHELEIMCHMDRRLAGLPKVQELLDRKSIDKGLTCPEIAVLLSYSKNFLKREILNSGLLEDNYFAKYLLIEFPVCLQENFLSQMQTHRLSNDIIATQISNILLNQMGITFISRMQEESGAAIDDIVSAFFITMEIFDKEYLWREIEALDRKVDSAVQLEMMAAVSRLVRRAARWFLRNHERSMDIAKTAIMFRAPIIDLNKKMARYLTDHDKKLVLNKTAELIKKGVAQELAEQVASCSILLSTLDIVQASFDSGFSVEEAATAYFYLSDILDLNWLRDQIMLFKVETHWDALARVAFHDDLDKQQRQLVIDALGFTAEKRGIKAGIDEWLEENNEAVERWRTIVADIRSANVIQPSMLAVGLRELVNLAMLKKTP
jgi:glutamate dehydrogenase